MTEKKKTTEKLKKLLVGALEEEYQIQENLKHHRFKKCPKCAGENPDPDCKHCWHCLDCGFTECAYEREELEEIIKDRPSQS